ncbi:MAG: PAS domain-containing protein [Pseudomonadales bacterium]|nr:PAS domain-containing protein [Pseudomonadales bacterium]
MRTGLVINPEVHALLLQGAAAASLLTRFLIFSRNPGSLAARMHAIFGIAVAWWLFCLAEVASATSAEAIEFYVRLSQIAVGMLPAVVYHLHVSITGDQRDLDRAILAHYGISLLITLFCMTSPLLFSEPYRYSWGPYPSYTLWGLIPMAWFLLVLIEVPLRYRQQMKRYPPGTLVQQKLRALYLGNTLAPVVMVDFLPAFGIAIYPFSYLISLVMHIATLFGALRFHLIEITTYIAAEKILNTMSDALIIIDRDGLIRAVNPAANQLFRCEDRLMIHRPVADLISDPALLAVVCMPIEQTLSNHEAEYLRTDGESRVLNLTMTDLQERGAVLGRIVTIRDVTDLRNAESDNERLQEEVRQAQKLETLGVMAGGIAHDFNNLLMAVFGSADLAQSKQFMGASIEKELRTIRSAAERGAELTNQLLTYAGEGR